MRILSLFVIILISSHAFAEGSEFKFDIEEFEKSAQEDSDFTDFGEDDEFNLSTDDPSGAFGDDEEDTFGDNITEDNWDKQVDEDLRFAPSIETPKLNPNTQVISTRSGKYIYHPNQEKGLYKINRNSEYLYKYKKSPTKGFFSIKAGQVNLENFPTDSAGVTFEDLYDSNSITALFMEYDWEPFKNKRSLSVVAGGGISYARGNGRFIADENGVNPNAGVEAREGYTFMLWSGSLGLTYKFKYKNDQLLLPFINGALDYNLVTEFRSSFKGFRFQGILGAHFGGGLALNLGWLEKTAALELDKEFGINNAYLSLEARNIISFDADNDINGLIFLAGLTFEY